MFLMQLYDLLILLTLKIKSDYSTGSRFLKSKEINEFNGVDKLTNQKSTMLQLMIQENQL